MLKSILLASAVMFSAPVLAQTTPSTPPAKDGATPTEQVTPQNAPMTGSATPVADPAAPAQAAAATEATPVTEPTGIAQVVNTEFPTYDKNADGTLSKPEFSAWMVALKTATDPATDAKSASVKTWVNGAFASADADKNRSVSKDELTGFLSKGA